MDTMLTMVRGDTLAFGLEIKGLDQDLESAYFTCKKNYDDENPLFEKSLGNGINKVMIDQYSVRVAPEDTEDAVAGRYYYDLELSANGDVFTVLRGILTILPDVTTDKEHGEHDDNFVITLNLVGTDFSVSNETLVIHVEEV